MTGFPVNGEVYFLQMSATAGMRTLNKGVESAVVLWSPVEQVCGGMLPGCNVPRVTTSLASLSDDNVGPGLAHFVGMFGVSDHVCVQDAILV